MHFLEWPKMIPYPTYAALNAKEIHEKFQKLLDIL